MAQSTKFRGIVEDWAVRGLIEPQQLDALLDDLSSRQTNTTRRGLVLILGFLGAVCISAAIFLFISSNWSWLPRLAKVGIGLSLPVIAIGLAAVTLSSLPLLSRTLRFFAVLLVGASIAILGQAYAVDDSVERLIRFWGGLGFLLGLVLLTEFGVAVAYAILVLGHTVPNVYNNGFVLTEFVLPLFVAGWLGYALSFLFVWGSNRARPFIPEQLAPNGDVIRAVGLFGVWVATISGYHEVLSENGATPFLEEYSAVSIFVASVLAYALTFVFVWGSNRARTLILQPVEPTGGLLVKATRTLSLFGVWVALIVGYANVRMDPDTALIWTMAYVTSYFMVLLAMVVISNMRGWTLMRNGSILMFLLMVFVLYCDIFSSYTDQAFFYLGGGLLLIALAILFERSRRLFKMGGAR